MAGGRPRKEINFIELDKLCALQCTQEEIASWFECSIDTIEARIKEEFGLSFPEYFKQKRGTGKISLRRKQYETALSGNVSMLIWLGKQYLGQSESGVAGDIVQAPVRVFSFENPEMASEDE